MSTLLVSIEKEPDDSVALTYDDDLVGTEEELDVGEDLVGVKLTVESNYRNPLEVGLPSSAFTEECVDRMFKQLEVTRDYDIRYNTSSLFVRGVRKLNDAEILQYFSLFSPLKVTRKGKDSCVVDFPNSQQSVDALLTLSQPLKRISRHLTTYNLFDEEEGTDQDSEAKFVSPLVRLARKGQKENLDVDMNNVNSNNVESADHFREVDTTRFEVPEGQWRVGNVHPKSDLILLQFEEVVENPDLPPSFTSTDHLSRKRKMVGDRITIQTGDLRDRLSKRRTKGLDDSWESVEDDDEADHGHDDRDRHAYVEESSSEELERILTREKLRPKMRMRADEEEENQRKTREDRHSVKKNKGFDLRDRISSHRR